MKDMKKRIISMVMVFMMASVANILIPMRTFSESIEKDYKTQINNKIVVYSLDSKDYDYSVLTGGDDEKLYADTVNGLSGYGSWVIGDVSANYIYTDINGKKYNYNFTKAWRSGYGHETRRNLFFTPQSECKVTVFFSGAVGRDAYIVQNGKKLSTGIGNGENVAFSAKITDLTCPVYVFGGSANKDIYAIIVEYYDVPSAAVTAEPTVTPTTTPTVTPDLFEVEKYRANYVLTNLLESMENSYFTLTPGRNLVENGRKNGLDNTTDFWRGMNDAVSAAEDISKIADLTFEEKDMYEAIIWNIFESGTDSKLISKIDSQILNNGKAAYDFASGQMKSMYNISVSDKKMYNSLSKDQKEEWKNLVSDSFKSEYPSLSKSTDLADKFDLFFDVAKDIEDVVNRFAAYCELASMQDSMKQVLKEMYQLCPSGETAMKAALLNCVAVMNSNETALLTEMALSVAGAAGKRLGQVGVSAMWSGIMTGVKNAHPAAAVFLTAYKTGTFLSNTLFNTDEIAEAYHKLDAVVKTEDIASGVYYKLKNQYNNDNTEINASNYNSAIDVMFNVNDYDCETSIAFIDSVDNSFAGDISYLFGDKTMTEKKTSVRSIQEDSYLFYESILTGWVYQLEDDNPNAYEQYKNVLDESQKRINKRYHIACPVDVYVYDENGQEVGSVVNNKAVVNDNSDIAITSYNDEKFVYLDDAKYSLEYKATGGGTMDITIDEYNEKGKTERTVGFDDLSLSKGTVYKSENSGKYVLTLNGTTVEPDYDTAVNKADAVKKQLEIEGDVTPENEPEEKKTETSFKSTVSSWAKEEVEEAYKTGLVPKVLVGEDLTKPVDRAEFAAIAVNLYENLSENVAKEGENPFNDIADNRCKSDILKAYSLGVTNGITDITFEPSTLISREQVATMLTRAYKKSEFPNWTLATDGDYPLNYMGVTKYADDDEISDYAKESVYFMTRWDILNGVDDMHFAPKNNVTLGESYGYATREQAVVIALRSAKYL